MAVGLQARDHVLSGFDRADLVICVGYDPVEYAPDRWNPDRAKRILAIDTQPAEVDASYQPEVELVGDIGGSLARLLAALRGQDAAGAPTSDASSLREAILADLRANESDGGWPIKPQKAIFDLRRALAPDDLVICDVGAHKVWIARLYQAYEPNTVIISNGFAAMGISVPGAIAASLVHPERKVVALTGDGAFLMNSQELETAKRVGARITVVVWRDDGYGLIDWKQRNEFGRPFGVEFGNPGPGRLRPELRHPGLPAGVVRRPVPDPDARSGGGRAVAGGRAHRLCRERPPDRAAGHAHGLVPGQGGRQT